jgi:diguanylate cyclase (GGDEF)-like protein/PAS domain S-box-containing protein
VEHDWRLVILAAVVCFFTSLAAMHLFHRAAATHGRVRVMWTAITGAATGCGIWGTHFIAMLAYDPGVATGYDLAMTAMSLIVAAIVTSTGFAVALYSGKAWSNPAGGAIVGGGIAAMHYIGMAALAVAGTLSWQWELVLLSIFLGVVLGGLALLVASRGAGVIPTLGAGVLLTSAIVSHHFTAMGAALILPDPTRSIGALTLSPTMLARAIAGVILLLLAGAVIFAVMERRASERRRAEEEWRNAEEFLRNIIENVPAPVLVKDPHELRCLFINRAGEEFYGIARAEIIGKTAAEVFPQSTAEMMIERDRESLLSLEPTRLDTHKIETPGNGWRLATTTRVPILGRQGTAKYLMTVIEDVTERKRAEEQIAFLAHHDSLTGLPNRAAFSARLSSTLERARESGKSFGVVCIDLDRFKEVNDIFGHLIGDALLKEVVRRFAGAAEGAFISRVGGDEFILIAEEGVDKVMISELVRGLMTSVAEPFKIDDHQIQIGLSAGIAMYPRDAQDETSLLGNADTALYRAKAEGRGEARFFEPEMDLGLRERRALKRDLQSALDRQELELHYQPQALVTGKVIGFEALLRWKHPSRGYVPPGKFISLGEESGLIMSIGEWVLNQACREAASWRTPLQIAVNLSPAQFRHGDLPRLVHSVLLSSGLKPSRLELEITEGVLIDDFDRALASLRRLKSLGVNISMDDFGTGYSSLSYLQAFPFDKIKIDRGFVSNLHRCAQSPAIIRTVIRLGQEFKVAVLAEGVETSHQLEFLSRENCLQVQGHLIGRPQPISSYATIVGADRTSAAIG